MTSENSILENMETTNTLFQKPEIQKIGFTIIFYPFLLGQTYKYPLLMGQIWGMFLPLFNGSEYRQMTFTPHCWVKLGINMFLPLFNGSEYGHI